MNGGDIIAKVLQKQGVKYLFTLCGGHISPIFVGCEQLGIRVIDVRHEVNAVFAADAVARLTGIPGVAAVTAGPGLTNTITAIKNAYLAQSPIIILGGATATLLKGRGSLQDIDQIKLMKPNVKWAVSISKVKDIVPILNKAFQVAQEGTPGPVFVECPVDILYPKSLVLEWYGAKSKEHKPRNLQEKFIQWYIHRHANKLFADSENPTFPSPLTFSFPKHGSGDLQNAISMLKKAQKPLLLLGSGAMMQPQKVQLLADAILKLNIPTYLSGMGRGLLGKNNPLQLKHKRKEAIKDADLIILAGVPNDFRLDYGNHIGHRPFISINRNKEDLYKNKKPSLPIHADPCDFLISLANVFQANTSEWLNHLKQRDQEREKSIDEQTQQQASEGINPLQLFRELEKLLPDDTLLIADGGDFVATASYTLSVRSPLTWLDPGVFGTLGVGAGFAIGAKLVYPNKQIWIIYGDGSAGYSLMEYDTFNRHKLPVISLIGNDACWNQIARDQVDFLKSDCAVNLDYSHYELIAKAFNGDGVMVDNIQDFINAIHSAQQKYHQGTSFIINAKLAKSDFRKGSLSM